MKTVAPIKAVIGVRRDGASTFYVRRSAKMRNYPEVWSLLSIQFAPSDLTDPTNPDEAQAHFDSLSRQRLNGAPLEVERYLTSGRSDVNPMQTEVSLHLFEIRLGAEPRLNPDYYTEGRWMTTAEYERASAGQKCGLCLRLWSDYAWLAGITDRPFVPTDLFAAAAAA